MKIKLLLIPVALVALGGVVLSQGASAQDAAPTSGELLAGEIGGATGAVVGPDGALYVPQVGTGGDQVLDPPAEAGFEGEVTFGLSASIIRIDPDDGTVTTEAENLPSVGVDGEGGGLADVAFIGSNLYFLLTGSADALGVEEWPNGVYRVTSNGTDATLVADISAFNSDNPVDFPDAGPGGNPFALERRGSGFVVSDGNYNRLLNVDTNGDISILKQFNNVVPTGLASGSSAVLNTWFSAAPHMPGESKVVSVAVSGGAVTELASGPSSMIDVSFGPDGNTYVLQFSDFVEDDAAPPTPSGRIYQLEDGQLKLLVEGFILPTSLDFDGDTAFVTTLTGQVWKIEDFSSIDPLPVPAPPPTAAATQPAAPTQPAGAAPTATPRAGVIGAPDTGDGSSAAGGSNDLLPLFVLGIVGAALALAGTSMVWKRR